MNRSKNAVRNVVFGMINKLVVVFLPFLIRSVIIKEFGADYLGLSSLFSSILQLLSLTELGLGTAIIYSMYKPVAENDEKTLSAILLFYRKIYSVIGIIILCIGLILIPFLPSLINGEVPKSINLLYLYLLYLGNTTVSYFLYAYKSSLITAYQRSDVSSNINTVVHIIVYSLQLIMIYVFHNYYAYTAMLIVGSVINNLSVNVCVKKLFPNIKPSGKLDAETKSVIIIKTKGLFIDRLCHVSRNAFDSIFLSAFFGLIITAEYSNYYYIMNSVIGFLIVITSSIQAGVGNSIATESIEKNYNDILKFNFLFMWICGICVACLSCLYQPFTELFFGKDMMFPYRIVILLCIYFFAYEMGDLCAVYSSAAGLWWESRYRLFTEAILNIILNYVLGKLFGVFGIISATIITLVLINNIWLSIIVFKHYFKGCSLKKYNLYNLYYAIVSLLSSGVSYFICESVFRSVSIISLFGRAGTCFLVSNIIFLLFYHKLPVFSEASQFIKMRLKQ